MIWDKDAIETLTKLVKMDVTFTKIADILGCTRNAAIGKSNRLHLKAPLIKTHYRAREKRVEVKPIQIKPVAPVVRSAPVKMVDLKNGDCRYPLGEGKTVKFCGDKKLKDSPYCQKHTAICFSPAKLKVIQPARTL